MSNLLVIVAILTLVVYAYIVSLVRWRIRSGGRSLPPGPKGLPFIGNVSHMRKPEPWKAHRELCMTYGDIVHVSVLGQRIVILGSDRAIFELLDKRSAVTSDRQQSRLIHLSGQDFNLAFMPYGQRWRRHRRAFWQHFLPASTTKYLITQRDAAHMLLRRLLTDPAGLGDHIRYTFAATIVKIIYGVEVAEVNDPHIALMETAVEGVQAFSPGRYLVDVLPVLQYVPQWMPGAGFQRELLAWRTASSKVKNLLYDIALANIDRNDALPSIVASLVNNCAKKGKGTLEELEIVKNVAVTAFEGGADTIFSTVQSFFLAMSLFPDAQRKAQEELDAIVGPNRLPHHDDIPALPYVNAVVKEVLRWQNVGPLSLPHRARQDVELDGYFIPKGTILLANTWACLHDPEVYPEPDLFLPERFLRDGKLDATVR